MLRLQNTFGPEQMVGGNQPQQPTMNTQIFQPSPYASPPSPELSPNSGQGEDELINRIIEMYKPKDTYMDQAAELLKTIPPREEPRMWRKIMGGVVGGLTRSIPAGREVIEGPYREKMADWAARFGPTSEIAKMEQSRNVNDRMMMGQILANEVARRRAGAYEQNVQSQIEKRQADIERDKSKLELQQWLAEHPEQKPIFAPDGFVYLLNERTGESVKTKVNHTEMSEFEKLRLQHKYTTEEIGARGAQARETEKLRQEGTEKRIEVGKWTVVNVTDPETGKTKSMRLNTVTGATAPIEGGVVEKPAPTGATERARISAAGGEGGAGESAKQRKTALYNKAQEAYNTHPEWRKYIKLHAPGTDEFTVYPPGRFFGPDKTTYDDINRFIYGTTAPTPMSGRETKKADPLGIRK